MQGLGVALWADGRRYEGNYVSDKKHGYGIYKWREKRKTYEGGWKQGKQHGPGISVSADGTVSYAMFNEGNATAATDPEDIEIIKAKVSAMKHAQFTSHLRAK